MFRAEAAGFAWLNVLFRSPLDSERVRGQTLGMY